MSKISEETILQNATKFVELLDTFGDRSTNLKKLYEDYGEYLYTAPASSIDHFHNAFPGGYVDHVLRVVEFAEKMFKFYSYLGMNTTTFSIDELRFAALNHDLGKLGFPLEEYHNHYVNPSDWHIKNQGKMYESNDKMPWAAVPDKSLFLLQVYSIPCTWNETLAIRLHDGLYDDANKQYYIGFSHKSKHRSNIMICLHMADLLASRYEFERWNDITKKIPENMNFNQNMIQ